MRGAWAVARREVGSAFAQPAGWLIVALFALLAGLVFGLMILVPGEPASMRAFFSVSGWLLLPVAPAIAMRTLAEESRSGTMEGLVTSPVGSGAVVVGKFVGSMALLVLMLVPTLVLVGVLAWYSRPGLDWGAVASGYVCLVLLGGLFVSVGVLASAVTSNATLAFMVGMFGVVALLVLPQGAGWSALAGTRVQEVLLAMGIAERVADFARGVVDVRHVGFFASVTAWFVMAAAGVQELRRWA